MVGYALWVCAGVLLSFGYAGMASIGIILLGLALTVIVAGVILPSTRNTSVVAIIAGLGAATLVIAWNNLGGPGTLCRPRWAEPPASSCGVRGRFCSPVSP